MLLPVTGGDWWGGNGAESCHSVILDKDIANNGCLLAEGRAGENEAQFFNIGPEANLVHQ